MTSPASYRFEPLGSRGVLLGLGPVQVVVCVLGVLAAFVMVSTWPGALGFSAAAGCLAIAVALCRPVRGRPPVSWVGVALAFAARRRRSVDRPPGHPHTPLVPAGEPGRVLGPASARGPVSAPAPPVRAGAPALRLPAKTFVDGVYLCQLPATADDGPLGVVLDQARGTAAAALRARGTSFCLLDGPEKDRSLRAWASVLESLAGGSSSLARFQWCQRAVPADSEALLAYLRQAGRPQSPGFAGHSRLLEGAGPRAWRHETLLVVSVPCAGRRGRPQADGVAALRNEARTLRAQMRNVGLVCEGVLDGPGLARALGDPLVPGLTPATRSHPWPLAFHEQWSQVRTDGLWHRTFWVAEWPRSAVGPDFLSPLLSGRGRRSFSVAMVPVPPERAVRDAESSRTAHVADAHLRAQGGFLETAQQRRRAEAVEGRETELADGRGAFELSGYVTVSADDEPGLERACADVQRSAAAARLRLRPLYGQQKEGLFWSLPLGRGV